MTTTEPIRRAGHGTVEAVGMLRTELARADSKASLLLALTGAALAGCGSAGPQLDLPLSAAVVGGMGVIALGTAIVLLLIAVRPTLAGEGWPSWHRLSDVALKARLGAEAPDRQLDEVRALQATARHKFGRIQGAVVSILVGVGALGLAGVMLVLR